MESLKNETIIHQKGVDARQLSGTLNGTDFFLIGIVKRNYDIDLNGRCTPSEEVSILNYEPRYDKENKNLLLDDMDAFFQKPKTDVIIQGHAYNKKRAGTSEALIFVDGMKKAQVFSLFGKRYARLLQSGKIEFTTPETFDKIALDFRNAYGGADKTAHIEWLEKMKENIKLLPQVDFTQISPFIYPRNTIGKGYVVTKNDQNFENLELPNIEDPDLLLQPKNLLVEDKDNWIFQPIPKVPNWHNHDWFPRVTYFGGKVPYSPLVEHKPVPELEQNLATTSIFKSDINALAANGAYAGLQLPYLKGIETIRTINIHPEKADFTIKLPGEEPKIFLDGRKGKMIQSFPEIYTIRINLDTRQLSIVWRAATRAIRPYHEDELKTMPFDVKW